MKIIIDIVNQTLSKALEKTMTGPQKTTIEAIVKGLDTVTQLGMASEKTAISFRALAGSQEKANKLLAECATYASQTPYSKLGVEGAAQRMLELGTASEKVSKTLRLLGGVALGDDQKLKSLAETMTQVSLAGKMQLNDLQALQNQGFNPLVEMSEITGKTVEELSHQLKEEGISAELLGAAFEKATSEGGRFHGLTEEIGKVPLGQFQILAGTLEQTLLKLYQVVEPVLVPSLGLLNEVLTLLSPVVDGVVEVTGWFIKGVREGDPYLVGFALSLGAFTLATNQAAMATLANFSISGAMMGLTKTWTILQYALNAAFLANPLGFVIALVTALALAVKFCWDKFAGFRAFLITTWEVVKEFGSILKEYVLDKLLGILEGAGLLGVALGKLLSGDFSGAWETTKESFSKMGGTISKIESDKKVTKVWESVGSRYDENLLREQQKEAGGIPTDELSPTGTVDFEKMLREGNLPKIPAANSTAAIGGGMLADKTEVHVHKFFDTINVHMDGNADPGEIEHIVMECLTRSLAVATNTAQ